MAFPQQAAAAYLDENFDILARPEVELYRKTEIPFVDPGFIRGDVNVDGKVNISDVIRLLNYLFRSWDAPSCAKAADANDDGSLNIGDATWTLFHLFHARAMPQPGRFCGVDPSRDRLGCEGFQVCEQ